MIKARDHDVEKILNTQQGILVRNAINGLRIEKEIMLNLKGEDAMVAEQFLCIICGNMVIPKFQLGATEGVKKQSVLIP